MKIKYKETETREMEKEIETPFYTKNGESYFKINSENDAICVDAYNFSLGINRSQHQVPSAIRGKVITKEEFDKVYSETLEYLKTANEQI